jgi:hypothetical protein
MAKLDSADMEPRRAVGDQVDLPSGSYGADPSSPRSMMPEMACHSLVTNSKSPLPPIRNIPYKIRSRGRGHSVAVAVGIAHIAYTDPLTR